MEKEESHLCVMGSCCVKQELTEEDIHFLKMHTRFDILVPFYNSEVVDPVGDIGDGVNESLWDS